MTVSTGATLAHSTSRRALASGSGWAPPWSRPDVHFRAPLAAADPIACEDSGGGEDLEGSRRRGRAGSRTSGAWEARDRTPRARASALAPSLARSLATGGTTRRGSARGGAGHVAPSRGLQLDWRRRLREAESRPRRGGEAAAAAAAPRGCRRRRRRGIGPPPRPLGR